MKKYVSYIVQSAAVLSFSSVLGLLLLAAVYMLPTTPIFYNVKASSEAIFGEGLYHQIMPNVGGAIFDNYTEALYLNTAMNGSEGDAVRAALKNNVYTTATVAKDPQENLNFVLNEIDTVQVSQGAHRFWNGYLILLKPMLTFFTYGEIRNFNMIMQILLLFLLLSLMEKKILGRYNPAILITYIFLNPVCLSMGMTFAGFFYCTIIPCIIMLIFNETLLRKDLYFVFFLLTGISVIYFNMNYFQIITFGIPLVFYYILNSWPEKPEELFSTAIIFFTAWFLGYAGMMVLKWILYAVFVSPEIFSKVFQTIISRTSNMYGTSEFSRLDAVSRNIDIILKNKGWLILEAVFMAVCSVKAIISKYSIIAVRNQIIVVFLILLIPVLRYIIFANHSYVHYWASYRCMAIAVFAVNVLFTDLSAGKRLTD